MHVKCGDRETIDIASGHYCIVLLIESQDLLEGGIGFHGDQLNVSDVSDALNLGNYDDCMMMLTAALIQFLDVYYQVLQLIESSPNQLFLQMPY